MDEIKGQILQLELALLNKEVRKSAQKVSEILSEDFMEFSGSGVIYHYKPGDLMQEDDSEHNWELVDFQIEELSKDCVLAMYKIIKHDSEDESKKYSLRSSVWKRIDGKWKLIFHQGTLSCENKINKSIKR